MIWMMMLMATISPSLAGEGFKKIGERDGVIVYRKHAHAIDLAAEGEIAAPPDVVRKVLLDYASHPKWVHNLGVSRVVNQGDQWLDVYQRLNLPMIDDRDYTLHVTWGDEDSVRWIRFHTVDGEEAPEPHVVRLALHTGSWQLTPIDNGQATYAVYRFEMELGGSMPMWMARGHASKDVARLFRQIRNQTQYYR
jgi:hypothetical protein